MYLKLALRNAKRSMQDYILYIFSMVTLISVLYLSNSIAYWGNVQAGFQTMALPLLIVVIMTVLVVYINRFIIRQRAKEFATYLLLGMDKNKLSFVFLCELTAIGLICFLSGLFVGAAIFSLLHYRVLQTTGEPSIIQPLLKSVLPTLVYFCCAEFLSGFFLKLTIYKLQIVQLMNEKRRNQSLSADKKSFWGLLFSISFSVYIALLAAIAFMPDTIMPVSVSFISLPMILSIYSFYKWFNAFLGHLRLSQADTLYPGNRLYRVAQMTTDSKTNAVMNTIFCVCLIFSAVSFTCGLLLLNRKIFIFESASQQWMGILQISLCIIFMTLCFYIFSLLQIIDSKKEVRDTRLLFYLGKNQYELKSLLYTQLLLRLFLPTLMSFAILLPAAVFTNYKLNRIFPAPMRNLTVKTAGGFMICFLILFASYSFCLCSYFHFKISSSRSRTRSSSPSQDGS